MAIQTAKLPMRLQIEYAIPIAFLNKYELHIVAKSN